ncbi:cadherin-like beta sandwich domain-containing protein [Mucilaginibacter sp.]|uniref:cadherin-like beta sandwich domain-containing protein n=1 Tax=Mucilaginibacter sp. TaxID=1882438 RepID=UPI003267AD14
MKKLLLLAVFILSSLYASANIGHSASLTLSEFTAAHYRDTALTGPAGNFDENASNVTANAATISNPPSSNANLANLTVSGHALSPAFSSSTLQYVVSVDSSETIVYFTPTVADAQAKITVDGQTATSGSIRGYFTNVGDNLVPIVVKAADGTTKTYSIIFKRKISSDNTLMSLSLASASISPAFNKNVLNYTATVASDKHKASLSFNTSASKETTKVNGVPANGGALVTLNPGNNTFNIEVTAENGAVRTYVLVITRPAENDAYLTDLIILQARFGSFAAINYNYTASVTNNISYVNVSPTLNNAFATVKVNGNMVSSMGYSAGIPLSVGANTITVTVTAEDGVTVRTYTITVNRAKAGLLSSLALSAGAISPGFDRNTSNYNVSVASTIASITVTPTIANAGTTITVNGVAATSGTASQAITLQRGLNTINIQATDDSGYVQTYVVKVTQEKSTDANLSNLTISQGTLSPAFNTDSTNYNVVVPSSVTSITVVPTLRTAGGRALIDYGNNTDIVASGATSSAIPLIIGNNIIKVISQSEDLGGNKIYTITVMRVRSVLLSDITISTGTLSPIFKPSQTTYTVTVPDSVSSITVLPVLTSTAAFSTVNRAFVASGSTSAVIPLQLGNNTISIRVQGKATGEEMFYSITVVRLADLRLSNLVISEGTLTPAFNSDTLNYKVTVFNSTTSVRFTLTPLYAGATMRVGASSVVSGVPSPPQNLSVANDNQFIEVSAGDIKKIYRVRVNRLPLLLLSNIAINTGPLTQVGTTDTWTASVSSSISKVQLTLGTQEPGTVKINGITTAQNTASAPVALTGTTTNIPMEATSADGVNKRLITVVVNRTNSNNTGINNLTISNGLLSRVAVTDKWAAVVSSDATSVQLTLDTKDPATVKINGVTTARNTASAPVTLTGTTTNIPIEITAEDGITKRLLTVAVTKTTLNNTGLSNIVISAGLLTRVGVTDTWAASVSSGVGSVQLTLGTVGLATIKVNGIVTAQNTASAAITLTGATTNIPLEITAGDGVTKRNITVTVRRAGSNNTGLNTIAISSGGLVREGATDKWVASVSSSVNSVQLTLSTKEPGTIKINNATTAQDTVTAAVSLTGATTTIPVEITAEDGVTKRFITVVVNKYGSSNTGLNGIAINTGPLSQGGTTDTWTALVSTAISNVQLTLGTQSPGTIKVNGIITAQNTASAPVTLTGTTTNIPVEVTAEDGMTRRFITVIVNKATPPVIAAITTRQGGISIVQETGQPAEAQPEDINIKQAVSPNGDGINDRFTIEGINAFPENTVRIINRNGAVVYETKGYDNEARAFDGRSSKGTLQQPGTYFYSVEYKKGTETKKRTGYFIVKY